MQNDRTQRSDRPRRLASATAFDNCGAMRSWAGLIMGEVSFPPCASDQERLGEGRRRYGVMDRVSVASATLSGM